MKGRREYATLGTASLDTSGRLRADLARARADRDVADGNLLLFSPRPETSGHGSYYRLLLARRLIQVSQQSLDEALAFEHRTSLLVQGQEAERADLVKASAEVQFLQQS